MTSTGIILRSESLGRITLDGGSATDPDSGPQPLTYAWSQIAGPTVTISSADQLVASFTPAAEGDYTFRLSADDGANTGSDELAITVGIDVPEPPTSIEVQEGAIKTNPFSVGPSGMSCSGSSETSHYGPDRAVYREVEFCLVEFALALANWFAIATDLGPDFVYTSLESVTEGLIRFTRRTPGLWQVSAAHQDHETLDTFTTAELKNAALAYIRDLRATLQPKLDVLRYVDDAKVRRAVQQALEK